MPQGVQESDSDLAELPEYELQHNSEGSSYVRKAVQHRMRFSWKQRALTVHHYNTTVPRPTLEELAEWCKQEFTLSRRPHITAISRWLHKGKQLIQMLADEESPRVQDLKAIYPERFPGLDDAVMQWFLKMESRRAVITDQVIQEKARDIARELKIDKFCASSGWLEKFKKRHNIQQYQCHGEAASADSLNVVLAQETFAKLFRDTPADNIYNG